MSRDKNLTVLQRAMEAIGAFEPDDLPVEDLFDPDVEIVNEQGWMITGPYSGHDGVREWARDMFESIESPHFELEDVIDVDDECLVISNRATGQGPGTGLPIDLFWWSVLRFRNGRILRAVGFRTRAKALEAAALGE
jgi:ketosteroid isomerase-like protein